MYPIAGAIVVLGVLLCIAIASAPPLIQLVSLVICAGLALKGLLQYVATQQRRQQERSGSYLVVDDAYYLHVDIEGYLEHSRKITEDLDALVDIGEQINHLNTKKRTRSASRKLTQLFRQRREISDRIYENLERMRGSLPETEDRIVDLQEDIRESSLTRKIDEVYYRSIWDD